jgi:hypothetical protein
MLNLSSQRTHRAAGCPPHGARALVTPRSSGTITQAGTQVTRSLQIAACISLVPLFSVSCFCQLWRTRQSRGPMTLCHSSILLLRFSMPTV